MTCSKPFSIVVVPGVQWANLLWGNPTFLNSAGGSALFTPTNDESNTWQASATAPANPDTGRVTIDGTLAYVGPARACNAAMVCTSNGVGTETGFTRIQLSFFVNAVLITSVTSSDGFNGTLNLPFTAVTGALLLRFDIMSIGPSNSVNQPKPMVVTCSGTVSNL